jgi:hypothetical protein
MTSCPSARSNARAYKGFLVGRTAVWERTERDDLSPGRVKHPLVTERELGEPEALGVVGRDGEALEPEVLDRPGDRLEFAEEAVGLFEADAVDRGQVVAPGEDLHPRQSARQPLLCAPSTYE